MRESRLSGSEGGATGRTGRPYPYSGDARGTRGCAPAVSRSDGGENPGAYDAGHAACGIVAAVGGKGVARRMPHRFPTPFAPRTAGACPTIRSSIAARPARSAARFAEGAEAGCLLPAVHEASGRSRTSRSIASEKHEETKDQFLLPAEHEASGRSRTSRSIASANTKRPMVRACCPAASSAFFGSIPRPIQN